MVSKRVRIERQIENDSLVLYEEKRDRKIVGLLLNANGWVCDGGAGMKLYVRPGGAGGIRAQVIARFEVSLRDYLKAEFGRDIEFVEPVVGG